MDFSEIKLGSVIVYNNQPCLIIKCEFLRMQQRKPVKKCILKNLITGNNEHYSFKSGETVEEADLRREPASFMYRQGDTLAFMLANTFETVELDIGIMDDKADYLKEGLDVSIVFFNENPISVDLPIKIAYTIIDTAPAVKGNTVHNLTKDATIETGKIIKVPAFIDRGDVVLINTIEDEYVERASK